MSCGQLQYSLSMKELKTKLFALKICRECGTKLIHEQKASTDDKQELKYLSDIYVCPDCAQRYTLEELA